MEVIRSAADKADAPLVCVEDVCTLAPSSMELDGQRVRVDTQRASYGTVRLPLLGAHQLENLATAVVATEVLCDIVGTELTTDAVQEGVASVVWPGRLQVLSREPPLIIDGAHNVNSAKGLVAALQKLLSDTPIALIWGMCRDKDTAGFMQVLAPLVQKGWAVPIRSQRSMRPGELVPVAQACNVPFEEATLAEALLVALDWAKREGGAVCVAGSLFLAGEVLEMLEADHDAEARD
jgi:dihydrofolate synthase/folylpolyglutamate synthase